MSPTGGVIPGVAPQAARSETNSSLPPPSGVGQNSWSAVLIAEPRFVIGPQGDRLSGRSATQMSFFPNPPARVEAMYSCLPFGDLIGQPSWAAVLTSATAVGVPQAEYSDGPWAAAGTTPAARTMSAPTMDAAARSARLCGPPAGAGRCRVIPLLLCWWRGTAPASQGGVWAQAGSHHIGSVLRWRPRAASFFGQALSRWQALSRCRAGCRSRARRRTRPRR